VSAVALANVEGVARGSRSFIGKLYYNSELVGAQRFVIPGERSEGRERPYKPEYQSTIVHNYGQWEKTTNTMLSFIKNNRKMDMMIFFIL
jgi:hypothetical protein